VVLDLDETVLDNSPFQTWLYKHGRTFSQERWTPWEQVSKNLPIALVAAEDQKFPFHHGFDIDAIQDALNDAEEGERLRGASTISQQVAKNLFLWNGRSFVRKGLEAYFTVLIETLWPKRRILEVYLNIAEFGDGVYGAAAASERYFRKSPAQLDARDSALLAAVLPNPRRYRVDRPSSYVQQRAAWIYNAGQRRVRRAPDLNYDNINDGTEGMRTTDQFDAYNGAPDRYDWKLVGKQEVYIPYNSYKLSDKKLKYKENIIRKNTVNPDVMRYELHRVWVIEANLKAGSKHIYGKRVFYLDEDSWTVVYEDAYDTRKQLWRVSMHPMIQFYDAKVPWYRANIWHDLSNGSYLLSLLENEIKTPWKFGEKGRWADFQPDALRRAGTK